MMKIVAVLLLCTLPIASEDNFGQLEKQHQRQHKYILQAVDASACPSVCDTNCTGLGINRDTGKSSENVLLVTVKYMKSSMQIMVIIMEG